MERFDVAILGGGTAGSAVAGLLAERTTLRVGLVEAGPDYGSSAGGSWPPELLDSSTIPDTHDWGYDSGDVISGRVVAYERAKVIGGCSTHNGCSQTSGHRADFDGWAAPGFNADSMAPCIERAAARLRLRRDPDDELTPFQAALLAAMIEAGIPRTDDFLELDGGVGCGVSPTNDPDGIRWNTAFAYLDPVRDSVRLSVLDHATIDRLEFQGGRATRAWVRRGGRQASIEADRFVLAAGAYGSPSILMRSGVGPPDELRALGIEVSIGLPGVGRNLHDQPSFELRFTASPRLVRELERFGRRHRIPDEQVIAKTCSSPLSSGYDLHIYPWTSYWEGRWLCFIPVACLTPISRGSVRITSVDPDAPPMIDTAFLSDAEGRDLQVLKDGLGLARELATSSGVAPLLGEPYDGVAGLEAPDDVALRASVTHYWHPAGTCSMGDRADDGAVVDGSARLHGSENVWVVDASIMPRIPRATPNLTVVALAERVAEVLVS